jgi:hypothetical protein
MENILINYLLKNCVTLAKEFFSSEKTAPEEENNTLNFLNLLDIKMGRGMTPTPETDIIDGTVSKENEDELAGENIPKEDGRKESSANLFDTQSIITLLQTYFKTQDLQDNTLQDDTQSVAMENFLQSVFSLLQEGESIQFTKEKPIGTLCLIQGSEEQGKTVEMDQYPVFESGKAMNNRALIGNLTSLLQRFDTSEKTDEKVENAGVENKDVRVNEYAKPQSNEIFQMLRKTGENIEMKKLNDRENVFQIISNELSSGESDEMNKNISVLTMKTEKVAASPDDDVTGVVSKVSDKVANDYAGPDERQLLSQNDYTKTGTHLDKEAGKVLEKTPFASIMTDRIEKIVEQYANKSISMDIVVRLKIDEKETLLVALKDQGQRVIVEVKTTNESMGTFLQSQKEEIVRQLEGKHIYANIYVDVQNENSQKRDQRDNQKKGSDEQDNEDFVGFLETMA